ncbi:integral membrane sensor signal transduction histidine kinase [Desulfovibrio sp. X2]|uniref:sensor histidine kinase n=1 Tax=Desulfovibrio sp. X2 TaxID=941449 RepID=UPI000358CCD9|nr:ATP-binding protein [Desulfovibrio sp. X2]EPR43444.1 integral membrane sensor signal transduction histidine kinase [Desulfovibrio sp. X2]
MRPPRLFRTASFRLAALYAALFALSASLLFGIIYWIASQALQNQVRDSLVREAATLAADQHPEGRAGLVRAIDKGLAAADTPPAYALLLDASNRKLTGNLPPLGRIEGFGTIPRPVRDDAADTEEEAEHAIIIYGLALADGSHLIVGEDGYRICEAQEAILRAFGWCMATTLLLAVGGGMLLSSGFLARLEAVNRTTRAIMAGDLDDRIPVRGTDDEMDRLAGNFNAMLDRVQTLMESLRQVSSDIAHDLRMPLQRLRQRLESAQSEERDLKMCREALDSALTDTDDILDIFGAMLTIAQIESGSGKRRFTDVDLSALAASLVESYEAVAEDLGQTLCADIAQGLTVRGDHALLAQMLVNLLENAMRHCPRGSATTLTLRAEDGRVMVSVRDNGPGIPEEEREKVFRRFYRMDRSRSTPGTGLGLPLAKAVADLHGASIELSDGGPGLWVRVRFPAP